MSYKIKTKIDGNSYIKTFNSSFKVFYASGGDSTPTPTPTEEEMYLCVYTFASTPTPTPTEEEMHLCVYTLENA